MRLRGRAFTNSDWIRLLRGLAEVTALDEMRWDYHRRAGFTMQEALIQTRRRVAKQTYDRLYGIAGLLCDADRPRLKIDYAAPFE